MPAPKDPYEVAQDLTRRILALKAAHARGELGAEYFEAELARLTEELRAVTAKANAKK